MQESVLHKLALRGYKFKKEDEQVASWFIQKYSLIIDIYRTKIVVKNEDGASYLDLALRALSPNFIFLAKEQGKN